MNLKTFTLGCFATMLFNNADAQLTSAAPYCDPGFQHQYRMFNTMKVKGTSFYFGKEGAVGPTDPFLYYNTTTFPDLAPGKTADIEIVPYAVHDGEPIYFAIWIDYNQNNAFDATELVMQNSNTIKKALPTFGAAVTPVKLTITIPTTAKTGKTRMRVMRGTNDADPSIPYSAAVTLNPCHTNEDFSYGCAYDFNVTIADGKPSAIDEHTIGDQVLFTPNPSIEGKIRIAESFTDAALRITDLSGKLVMQQDKISNTIIDVSSFQPGMYFLSVSKDGQSYAQSLQVN